MTGPLVSVIVPVFNGARFLAAALGSILDQDYQPLQIIVVADRSADATAAVANSFPQVIYLRRQHQGLAATRNAGVTLSRGEFLAFLDSDDIWPAAKTTRQVTYLLANPEVDLVVGHLKNFLEPGCSRPSWLKPD